MEKYLKEIIGNLIFQIANLQFVNEQLKDEIKKLKEALTEIKG